MRRRSRSSQKSSKCWGNREGKLTRFRGEANTFAAAVSSAQFIPSRARSTGDHEPQDFPLPPTSLCCAVGARSAAVGSGRPVKSSPGLSAARFVEPSHNRLRSTYPTAAPLRSPRCLTTDSVETRGVGIGDVDHRGARLVPGSARASAGRCASRQYRRPRRTRRMTPMRGVRCGVRTFGIAALSPMVFMNTRAWP